MDMHYDNHILDRIIRERRTVRSFLAEIPAKELICQIIEAGRLAPFAGLPNAGTTDFRHFFVISNKSKKMVRVREMVVNFLKAKLPELEKQNNPRMQTMINVARTQVENGPRVGSAPWLIIVAERRGYPAREQEAIAHVMQNMWLKATALGLGFQLTSVISDMNGSKELSDLVGLPKNEYSYDGSMLGYSEASIISSVREAPHLSLTWFE
jgi:nitroreductase